MTEPRTPHGTDPRVTRTQQAVTIAAREVLLSDGPDAVTHQRVAEVAGVGRATLYRHWPQPDDLLYLAVAPPPGLVVQIGDESLRDYLIALVERTADTMSQPLATVIFTTMLQRAQRDERARQMRDDINDRMVFELERAIRSAKARGEHVGALRAERVIERLIGPVMFCTLMLGRHLDRTYARELVDSVLG